MFIDVSQNTEHFDLMIYVEEWTFTQNHGIAVIFVIFVLVNNYTRIMYYLINTEVDGKDAFETPFDSTME